MRRNRKRKFSIFKGVYKRFTARDNGVVKGRSYYSLRDANLLRYFLTDIANWQTVPV